MSRSWYRNMMFFLLGENWAEIGLYAAALSTLIAYFVLMVYLIF